jgi:hypothetical protein
MSLHLSPSTLSNPPNHSKFALAGLVLGASIALLGVCLSGLSEGSHLFLAILCGGMFGFWFGLALWATLQKRRLPRLVLGPAWALVGMVGSFFLFIVPVSIFCQIGFIPGFSAKSTREAILFGGIVSILLSPLGFFFGLIFGFCKPPLKAGKERPPPGHDGR